MTRMVEMFQIIYYCPNSSSAATSFNASFNQSSCAIFGELDFTDSTSNNSWDAIADTCITETMILQCLLLRQQSHDTQPHPLIDGRCQSYTFFNDENMCQYRMDCLLRFLTNTTSNQYGYIHLRNISSDQLLFEAAITDLFNTSQNPLFTFSNTSKDCPKGKGIAITVRSVSISVWPSIHCGSHWSTIITHLQSSLP